MQFCTKCGSKRKEGTAFCTTCGLEFDLSCVVGAQTRVDLSPESGSQVSPSQPSLVISAKNDLSFERRMSIYLKAGINSLIKTCFIGMVVFLPGIYLLEEHNVALGRIWLFLGAFGMMAWSYRKPWKLLWITCLLPPIGACLCYILQLVLFANYTSIESPSGLIVTASVLGVIVGLLRGRTHEIYIEGPFVMAKRTFGYLLVWVVSYGISYLALVSMSDDMINIGLVTGAFSTAMFSAVSFVLLEKKSQIGRIGITHIILIFFVTWSFIPSSVLAANEVSGKYKVYLTLGNSDKWEDPGWLFYFQELSNNRAAATFSIIGLGDWQFPKDDKV